MTRVFKSALTFGCSVLLCSQVACSQVGSVGQSATQVQSNAATSNGVAIAKQWTGLLTLKGSEPGIWWALSVSGDRVYRLEGVDAIAPDAARTLQSQTVRVAGKVTGNLLSTPIITVEAIALVK